MPDGTAECAARFDNSLVGTAPRVIFAARFPEVTVMASQLLPASAFQNPAVALSGVVDYNMYVAFRQQFGNASAQDFVVIELATLGGDPEVARMMGEDVRFATEMAPQRRFVFLGKAAIYSAGTTFMSFFARENRYLTRGSRLMIHERKLSKNLIIDGPLTTCLATVQATLNEIECSIAIQNEGFQNLINGSQVPLEEVIRRAPSNWYLEAQEAKKLGLIEAVL
jgi:ATP-dependent protease ClpP protease subunit